VQCAGTLQQRRGLGCQRPVAGQAEQEVHPLVVFAQCHQLRVGEMTIPPQQDVRVRPDAAQPAQYATDDRRVLAPGGALAGPQHGGDELTREPLEQEQRQVAVAAVVVVVEGKLLLAVGAILGVIHVQQDHRRRFGITGDEGVDEGLRQAVDVPACQAVLQPRKGRPGGERVVRIQRRTLGRQLEDRIMPQVVGVIAVGVAAGGLKDALTQQVGEAVVNVGRMAPITDGRTQALDQASLAIRAMQQQRPEVARQRPALEVGPHREVGHGRKAKLGRGKLIHGQSRLCFVRSGIGVSPNYINGIGEICPLL